MEILDMLAARNQKTYVLHSYNCSGVNEYVLKRKSLFPYEVCTGAEGPASVVHYQVSRQQSMSP